jgi:Tetratricopeptide repeat
MRARRRLWIVALLVGAAALIAGGIARGIHHELYDAFLVPVVADRAVARVDSPEQAAQRLNEFVYMNLRMPIRAPVFDDTNNREVLLRGFAYCDEAVFVFIHLLQEKDISGRMTFLRRRDGVSPHTVAEAFLGREWRVFDTLFGFVPRRSDGAMVAIRDLVAEPSLLGPSRIPPEWYAHAKVKMVRGPARRMQGGPWRVFATQAFVRGVAAWTPAWLTDRLQDLYLALPARVPADPRFADDPASAALFFRARHLHVFQRARPAAEAYTDFLRRHPDHPATDHVLYYLGLVQLTQLDDPVAARTTWQTLLDRFPRTPWRAEAEYLLGRARERAGDCAAATKLYRQVTQGDGNGREDAALRLTRLACA